MQKQLIYHPESDCFFVGPFDTSAADAGCTTVNAADLPAGTQIQTAGSVSTVLPSMDFETYSEAGFYLDHAGKIRGMGSQGKGGLPVVGTPAYAEHPSTEVLCLYYNLKDGHGRRAWLPGTPNPEPLLAYIRGGGLIEAWNTGFEFWIWNMVCVRRLGWPPLALSQCRCAMAKARRHSLPGSLGNAAKVLGTAEKDPRGHQLVQRLTRPHTPTKNRPAIRRTPATDWSEFLEIYAYCDQDTVTEDNAAAHISDLTPDELETWLTDQTINVRGVQVDTVALDNALSILEQTEQRYTEELATLTNGAVNSVSEVANFGEWLAAQGNPLPNLQKETVKHAVKTLPASPSKRALEIRQILGSANVKKLRTLKIQLNSDGRLRNQYMYCGADRTGRWSAGGVQLQNITAAGPSVARCESCEKIFGSGTDRLTCPRCDAWLCHSLPEWTIEAVEQAIEDVSTCDLARVEHIWGNPIDVLCGCLRGLFIAKEGHKLICVDFTAIEAVAAACLSRCQWRFDVFSTHGKIYEMSASKITGTPMHIYDEYKTTNGVNHPDRKKIGKVAELASAYGGWINAWKAFGADMSDEDIKTAILAWREASPEIVDMWGGQFRWCGPGKWDYMPELFGLEGAAISAILNPGQHYQVNDIFYHVSDDILFCTLPSGRKLHYHRPRLADGVDKLNRGPCYTITFEGHNSNPAMGPIGWHRKETFGGRQFENVVQAVALDIQAEALKRCELRGYPIVMHTHDEGTAEVPTGFGSVGEMAAIMSERPTWASWWPLKAAGWEHKRYQKD